MQSSPSINSLLQFTIRTLEAAGEVTLKYFQRGPGVDLKQDQSPVTAADREAEALIRDRIHAAFPDHGILGEEYGIEGDAGTRWVIDPIDGTKSFVAGVPLYGCLLSFEEDGQPMVAGIYFPALGLMVGAARGSGATCNGSTMRVSTRETIEGSIICCGSHKNMGRRGIASRFETEVASIAMATRTWGDAYGHFLVASGRVDAMIDPVVERYDISGPSLIVHEAGGACTNLLGESGLHREALSSNGMLHQALVDALGAPRGGL